MLLNHMGHALGVGGARFILKQRGAFIILKVNTICRVVELFNDIFSLFFVCLIFFSRICTSKMEKRTLPSGMVQTPINIDSPRWNQSTFLGRLNHFVRVTNPFLSLKTNTELNNAKELVEHARF